MAVRHQRHPRDRNAAAGQLDCPAVDPCRPDLQGGLERLRPDGQREPVMIMTTFRMLAIAAALTLGGGAASATPPLEGGIGYHIVIKYRTRCNPPSPTVSDALLDEIIAKGPDLSPEQLADAERQAEAIFKDLGRIRFCRELSEAIKEDFGIGVADAQVQATLLGQLANLKNRYAAAKSNDLLQESIVKQQKDTLCTFFKTYEYVVEWDGTLLEVKSDNNRVLIVINLNGPVAVSAAKRGDSIVDAVSTIVPGTRIRFSGDLFDRCGGYYGDRFFINLERIVPAP
jgi:hypothetical protein